MGLRRLLGSHAGNGGLSLLVVPKEELALGELRVKS
jgi:hypothetical protein